MSPPRGQTRGQRYSKADKEKALALADEETAVEASKQLGIPLATIYSWRQKKGLIRTPSGVKDPEAWAEKKELGAREAWKEGRAALALVRQRLEQGEENKAKSAALAFAILMDKSAQLEQASALAEERKARIDAAVVERISQCFVGIFRDLEIPRGKAIRGTVEHHLRALWDEASPKGPAPSAADARQEIKQEFTPPPPMPDAPAIEAEVIEDAEPVDEVEQLPVVHQEDKGEVCAACGERIPPYDLERHFNGKDGRRPQCPRQDMSEFENPKKDNGGMPHW